MNWELIAIGALGSGLALANGGWSWLSARFKRTATVKPSTDDIDDLGHRMIAWFDQHGGDVRDDVRELMRLATDLEFPPKE